VTPTVHLGGVRLVGRDGPALDLTAEAGRWTRVEVRTTESPRSGVLRDPFPSGEGQGEGAGNAHVVGPLAHQSTAFERNPPPVGEGEDGHDLVWCSGAIDPHINGWGGCDFLRDDPADHRPALRALCAAGVTGFLPTLITCAEAELRTALERWSAWAAAPPADAPRFHGLHLEGPFLDPARAGVHPRHHLRTPDAAGLVDLLDRYPGLIRLVTLAPELPGALEVIEAVVARGVTVALGHSSATAVDVERAVARGARYVTHLFNAMAPFHHRAAGLAGAALARVDLYAEVIGDGQHVGPEGLVVAWRCLGAGRLVLVSDAVSAAGAGGEVFRMGDIAGRVVSGRAVDPEGRLCGGLASPWEGVRRVAAAAGVGWEAVVPCVRATVIAALGLDAAVGPAPGGPADLVGLDRAGQVRAVLRNGAWLVMPDSGVA
jgi:N-acetylglucosamine-6-phosphate deacetylase